jgi:hypothetical protein
MAALAGMSSIIRGGLLLVKRFNVKAVGDAAVAIRMELDALVVALLIWSDVGWNEQGANSGDD